MFHESCGFLHGFTHSLTAVSDPRSRRIRWTLPLLALLGILLAPGSGSALTPSFSPDALWAEHKQLAESIAAYPASARRAAFIVASYPEELLEIQKIQRASAGRFAELVSSYAHQDQEKIWNLIRHPGLAAELAQGGRKSDSELERIASRYPAEDRTAIAEQGRELYPIWVQIYALELEAEQAFSELLSNQPDEVRSAFDELTRRPDLLSILIDNMRMTTVLGALYRDDREGVEAHFDALHGQLAARQQEEERAWSDEVTDPDTAEELERAARAFAEAYDYDLEVDTGGDIEENFKAGVESDPAPGVQIENYVVVHPYPYWFGYPYWYDVAYWYPLPVWRHIGFRFRHGHGFASVGLPSRLFLDWYHVSYVPHYRLGHRDRDHQAHYRQIRYYEKHRPRRSASRSRHHDSRSQHLDRSRRRPSDSRTYFQTFLQTFSRTPSHSSSRTLRIHDSRRSEPRDPSLPHRNSEQLQRHVQHERPANAPERREKTRERRETRKAPSAFDRQRRKARRSPLQIGRAHPRRERQSSTTRNSEGRLKHGPAQMERRKAKSIRRQQSHRTASKSASASVRKHRGPRQARSSSRSGSHMRRPARSRR